MRGHRPQLCHGVSSVTVYRVVQAEGCARFRQEQVGAQAGLNPHPGMARALGAETVSTGSWMLVTAKSGHPWAVVWLGLDFAMPKSDLRPQKGKPEALLSVCPGLGFPPAWQSNGVNAQE